MRKLSDLNEEDFNEMDFEDLKKLNEDWLNERDNYGNVKDSYNDEED